jgi:hypothetical protein
MTNKRRKPYPSTRRPRKTVFTPAMWARWLTPAIDETTVRLRAGIAEFRHRLRVGSDAESRS